MASAAGCSDPARDKGSRVFPYQERRAGAEGNAMRLPRPVGAC